MCLLSSTRVNASTVDTDALLGPEQGKLLNTAREAVFGDAPLAPERREVPVVRQVPAVALVEEQRWRQRAEALALEAREEGRPGGQAARRGLRAHLQSRRRSAGGSARGILGRSR